MVENQSKKQTEQVDAVEQGGGKPSSVGNRIRRSFDVLRKGMVIEEPNPMKYYVNVFLSEYRDYAKKNYAAYYRKFPLSEPVVAKVALSQNRTYVIFSKDLQPKRDRIEVYGSENSPELLAIKDLRQPRYDEVRSLLGVTNEVKCMALDEWAHSGDWPLFRRRENFTTEQAMRDARFCVISVHYPFVKNEQSAIWTAEEKELIPHKTKFPTRVRMKVKTKGEKQPLVVTKYLNIKALEDATNKLRIMIESEKSKSKSESDHRVGLYNDLLHRGSIETGVNLGKTDIKTLYEEGLPYWEESMSSKDKELKERLSTLASQLGVLKGSEPSDPQRMYQIPFTNEEAQRMAEAYAILYLLENRLREFIEDKLEERFGVNWWEESVSREIRENCEKKRKKETESPWHEVKESHPLWYTDFHEIQSIIQTKWEVFQPYFHDQHTVIGRLSELEIPRNTIAHNRLLEKTELERLRIFSHDIFKCIIK